MLYNHLDGQMLYLVQLCDFGHLSQTLSRLWWPHKIRMARETLYRVPEGLVG